MTLLYSSCAVAAGFVLDMIFGDPKKFPHIVRFIGLLINRLENQLRKSFQNTESGELYAGVTLVIAVALICIIIPVCVLSISYKYLPLFGFAVETILCWQILAVKSLRVESMKVFSALTSTDVTKARRAVAMIVGRDTDELDKEEITLAAVETVAENTSDGVIAPMFFILLGGAAAGCLYKAINTMDSMLGYKNDKYLYFGRCAACLDDIANFLPARLTAIIAVGASFLLKLDYHNAYEIWKRDRRNHASPNSAQSMSVFAGVLNIRMGGHAVYHGRQTDKPYIGDDTRTVTPEDIGRANRITFVSSVIMLGITLILRGIAFAIL